MTLLQILSLLIVLAGVFGAVNHLFLRLPQTIGILIVALAASATLMAVDQAAPSLKLSDTATGILSEISFSQALLQGMLGLLLFAGALHVKVDQLRAERLVVLIMATVGVGISTVVVGGAFSWATGLPLVTALLFGALIAPTDPVAVLGVLRETRLPAQLETQIAGESLFNDGVGYAVFLVLLGLAYPGDDAPTHALGIAALFLREAGGGALLGLGLGWFTFRVMRRIDDYALEVLLTLSLAAGAYVLAQVLEVSAPITAVCAGLLIGDIGTRDGMSETTRRYVDGFWTLIDEILNAVLFLLIGFEVFAIAFDPWLVAFGVLAIVLSLLARLISVAVPVALLRPFRAFAPGVVPIMTWGGLKGGISVALALSLPAGPAQQVILTATYMVVVFSIIVQGLTVGRLAERVNRRARRDAGGGAGKAAGETAGDAVGKAVDEAVDQAQPGRDAAR